MPIHRFAPSSSRSAARAASPVRPSARTPALPAQRQPAEPATLEQRLARASRLGHNVANLAIRDVQRYSRASIEPLSNGGRSRVSAPAEVQRYSSATFTINSSSVTGTLSENGKYFLPKGPIQGGGQIYATSAPNACSQVGSSTYSFNSKTYALYEPQTKFLDDCLHTAEEIVNGKILAYGTATYSRDTVTNYVFGQSDKRNIEIVEAAKSASAGSVDGNADAGTGNAFVIVDTEFETKKKKRSPYHAGGVIGVDGSDRITMEVFAGGGSLDKRETDSTLSMYTVGGSGSFHNYWSTGYFSAYKTITIVIKAK